jgi:hypothetical protein
MTTSRKRYMSGLASNANPLAIQVIPPTSLGHSYPRQYPQPHGGNRQTIEPAERSPLGLPLSIREVARMIGCSAWTIRQRHIPAGLPHFRAGSNGKLVFFREQVIAWILQQQKKGG